MESSGSPATTAIHKLEEFFQTLNQEEREVISELVRASLIQAAERFEGADFANVPGVIEGFALPGYVSGLTGQNAPALVKSLRLPGSLLAHSIPGCNASAMLAVQAQFGRKGQ